jgi:hypothetical protein
MSRWAGLRGRVAHAIVRPQAEGDSRVELAVVHDGRTFDIQVRWDVPGPHVLVLTCGDVVVTEPLERTAVGRGSVRAVVDTAALPAGTWTVAVRAGDGVAVPLVHRPEQRQDGPARAQDGPLSLLAARSARLGAGKGGGLELRIEDVPEQPVVVEVVATPDGAAVRLAGPIRDGDELVARSPAGDAVVLGAAWGGPVRCALGALAADPGGPVLWRVLLRRDGTEQPLPFHVADLGRPGAAIKFPALDLTEDAGVVRRRPVLAGGALAFDVRVRGGAA